MHFVKSATLTTQFLNKQNLEIFIIDGHNIAKSIFNSREYTKSITRDLKFKNKKESHVKG